MSDSNDAKREKRGWFRRSRPIDIAALMTERAAPLPPRSGSTTRPADERNPKRSADMFRGVENGDAWSSSAWAEDGWDDDWSDPTSKRASVRPAADPRPEDVDAWLESGSSDFAEITRDIAERWVGRAGRAQAATDAAAAVDAPAEVGSRRKGLSLDTLRSNGGLEVPERTIVDEHRHEPVPSFDAFAPAEAPRVEHREADPYEADPYEAFARPGGEDPPDARGAETPADGFADDLEDATRFHAPRPDAATDDFAPSVEFDPSEVLVAPGLTWDVDDVQPMSSADASPQADQIVDSDVGSASIHAGRIAADLGLDDLDLASDGDLDGDFDDVDDVIDLDASGGALVTNERATDDAQTPAVPAAGVWFDAAAGEAAPDGETAPLLKTPHVAFQDEVQGETPQLAFQDRVQAEVHNEVQDHVQAEVHNHAEVQDQFHEEFAPDLEVATPTPFVDETTEPTAADASPEPLPPIASFESVMPLDDIDAAFARGPANPVPETRMVELAPALPTPVDEAAPQYEATSALPSTTSGEAGEFKAGEFKAGEFKAADFEDGDFKDGDFEDEEFEDDFDDDLDGVEFEDDLEDDWEDDIDPGPARVSPAAGLSLPPRESAVAIPAPNRAPAAVPSPVVAAPRVGAPSSRFCTAVGTGIVLVASVRMLLALASGIVTSEGVGAAKVDVVNRIGAAFTGLGLFHGLALIVGAMFLALPSLLGDEEASRHDSRAATMLGIAGGAAIAGVIGGLLGIRAGLHGIDATATDWTRILGDAVAIAGSSLVALWAALHAIRVRSSR